MKIGCRCDRVLLALLLTSIVLLLLPVPASAQAIEPLPTSLTVTAPENVPLGNLARVVAVLRDSAGKPIPEARIVFTSPASFAGTTGEMNIGEVWTDSKGVATLDYQTRIEGQNQFIARFYSDGDHQAAEASTVVVSNGNVQLSERTAGVFLPVFGSWTIIAVLAAVWSTYFLGMLQIFQIPTSQGKQPWSQTGGQP